jgi:hypothetical protein
VIYEILAVAGGAAVLFAVSSHRKERASAIRADVLEFVHRCGKSTDGGWIHGGVVIEEFGPRAYGALRSLVERGRLEDCEGPIDAEALRRRGDRPRYFYRLSDRRRQTNP